jgi:undecaprenyl-diphosphatase
MIDRIIEMDYKITLWLSAMGNPFWDKIWVFITDKYSSIPLYLLLFYVIVKKFKKSSWIYMLMIIATITATDQTSNLFKNGFRRLRPFNNLDIQEQLRNIIDYGCPNSFSFFSAHAANSAAIAVFFILSCNLKGYARLSLILWAFMLGFSRLYLGVHYFSDVIIGFVIGGFYGYLFYSIANYIHGFILKKQYVKSRAF